MGGIVMRNWMLVTLNPLHPKISMYILHTPFYTFPKLLTRRICLPIKASFVGVHLFFILMTLTCDSGVIQCGEI